MGNAVYIMGLKNRSSESTVPFNTSQSQILHALSKDWLCSVNILHELSLCFMSPPAVFIVNIYVTDVHQLKKKKIVL